MTPQEYIQLKAFARQDGVLLALLWTGSLLCYILGMTYPLLGIAALILIAASPFFAAQRLRHYRDYGREGVISFSRSYAYTVLLFFYGGVLFAITVYVYFAFLDKGFFLSKLIETFSSPEGREAIKAYGIEGQLDENIKFLSELRPIDMALNMLTINIIMGFFLGVPIAAIMQKAKS